MTAPRLHPFEVFGYAGILFFSLASVRLAVILAAVNVLWRAVYYLAFERGKGGA